MSAVGASRSQAAEPTEVDRALFESESLIALRSAAGVALIATTVVASLIGFIDAGVINVAVPALGRHLHASVASLQWILTSYLVAVAALLLLSGALADH